MAPHTGPLPPVLHSHPEGREPVSRELAGLVVQLPARGLLEGTPGRGTKAFYRDGGLFRDGQYGRPHPASQRALVLANRHKPSKHLPLFLLLTVNRPSQQHNTTMDSEIDADLERVMKRFVSFFAGVFFHFLDVSK